MNTPKTTFMNRKAIEKEAMHRFGMCQYVDTITPSPKADGKRFVRTYWTKNHSRPVAKLYIYEATGKVYLKDMLKNETISNVHSPSEWQSNKSAYSQPSLF